MAGRECTCCSFTVNPYLPKLGINLALHQVVADLVNQFQFLTENLLESCGDLFEDNQTIQDRVISARRYGI